MTSHICCKPCGAGSRLLLLLLLLLVAFGSGLLAQTTGVITGTVNDSTGAVIAGAKVTIRNLGTNQDRVIQTNETGAYVGYSLPVGMYSVEVTAPGFKKATRSNIQLSVADRLGINFTLEVGNVTETVEVTAAAPVVETEKGDVNYMVSTKQMTDLAVNGRTFLSLQQLLPGASRTMGDEGGLSFNSGKGFAINGQRDKYSGIQVDGVENTDMGSQNGMFTSPGMETVAELKVQTSNYSAEYGTAGASNILVVTRTGTKDLHGAAYEFLRNDAMDARNFFAATKPTIRFNNFGYRIGGPVTLFGYNRNRDKTFFFWAQEWRRKRTQQIFRAATPTAAMRAGDFSAEALRTGAPLIDPDTNAPFPDNRIPANRLNRNAQLLLENNFPMPNTSGFLNYISNGPNQENWRQETINITHELTNNTRATVRYIQDSWTNLYPGTLWAGQSFPNITSLANIPGKSFLAKATTVISPTLLNEVSYAYGSNYPSEDQRGVALNGPYLEPQGLNIPRLFPRIEGRPNKIPNIAFTAGWGNIDTSYYPWWAHHNIATVTDIVSKTVGAHSLKFGGTFQFSKTPVESQVNPADQGGFTFNGSFSNHPHGDFLLGRAASYRELDKLLRPSYDYPQLEMFVQDSWKVNRRLTLNLGVRWFWIPHAHEASDLITNFVASRYDPAKAVVVRPDNTLQPGVGDPINGMWSVAQGMPRTIVPTHPYKFGPRLGFAWDPTGSSRWAIRGGYGVGYYRVEGNDIYSMVGNPPNAKLVEVFNPPLDNPSQGTAGAARPVSVNALDPVYNVPYVQSYSFEMQRELTGSTSMSVGYVGTRGVHLDRARNVNQPLPVGNFDFDPRINARSVSTDRLRPFPGYVNIGMKENVGQSTYHSLQATLKRRLTSGLLFDVAYTWSRVITDASGFNEGPQNAYNLRAERGPATFDRTHMLVFNYIYELPILRNANPVARGLLGGWQISGITVMQSGTPRNVGLTGGDIGLAGRPDVVAGQSAAGPKTVAQWFNTAAFSKPAPGFFGNAGRNLVRGPGIHTWDVSMFKNFRFHETWSFQLRGEAFNIANNANFDGLSMALGAGNFGQVTSARQPRTMQVSAKFEF
jgi:hypothetical protein